MNPKQDLKVVINAVSAKSGGAATYVKNLINELNKIKPEIQFIFYIPSAISQDLDMSNENIKIVSVNENLDSPLNRFLWDQIFLRNAIKAEKADILLSSSDFGMLFPPCRQILMIRNPLFFSELYFKNILPYKSIFFKIEFFLKRFLISLSARSSDKIITASKSMLNDVKKYINIPDDKAVVNPFGVPFEKFNHQKNNDKNIKNDSVNLLYVSEYGDYKNLTTLLKAFLVLRENQKKKFYLTATLDPSQFPKTSVVTRELDRKIADNPSISPYINFTGSVKYEDMKALYEKNDIFVFPSIAESFGHPLVEAMAMGMPIIASDIPVHREICGEAVLYFSPLEHNDLADKITILSNDNILLNQLKKSGEERVRICFNWEGHVSRLIDIIQQYKK